MRIERETFEELVRRHHAAVYRAARRIVRSDADAEDVSQQVFLCVLRGRQPLPAESEDAQRVLRWLASRTALTLLRAGRRRRHHETETARMNREPSERPMASDELAALRAGVEGLEESQRTAIVLRFHEGMTLAEIAGLTGCAESTVPGRVRAALDRLRHRLREVGFAAAGARLESLLPATAVASAVPGALQATLLALSGSIAGGLAMAKFAAVGVLVLAVIGAGLAFETGGGPGPAERVDARAAVLVAVESSRVDAPVGEQDPVRTPLPAPASPPPVRRLVDPREAVATAPRATLEGLVLDDSEAPLEGVVVAAHSRELSRKADPFEVRAVSDAQGRFSLELPITNPDGMQWLMLTRRDDWVGGFTQDVVHLRPNETRRGLQARLRRWAQDVAGEWRAEFVVADGAGRAVPGVHLAVFRRQRGEGGVERLTRETGGTSGVEGRLALEGDHLGEKLVRVIPWGKPFARHELPLVISHATNAPIAVTLNQDVPLEVRVVSAREGMPIPGAMVSAERGDDSHAVGNTDAAGRVLLRGLDGGPVTLRGGGSPWSRFALDDVLPAHGVATLRLKREDDPESIGLHGAEIHGRLVDAATGAPVVAEHGCVRTWWLPADSSQTLEELLRNAITPGPFQTSIGHDPPPPSAEFHLTALEPARYALIAEVPGFAIAGAGPFELAAGALVRDVSITLGRGTRLVVEVRDDAGRPVADAWVWIGAAGAVAERARRAAELADAIAAGQPEPYGRGERSDVEGRVAFEHVPDRLALAVHAAHRSRLRGGS
ncbi:MAG: sigma-70 family RNA polymerase sigma factor [Planctomycetes bacterium]|nr:sigma-70 family RNA polymerase sigma factor [Planctomycetota bacterium]